MSYTVVSWNIARDSDYLGVNLRCGNEEWSSPQELYSKRKELIASRFSDFRTKVAPDFFCLQEVDSIKEVKERALLGEYDCAAATKRDCVILWNRDRFTPIAGSEYEEGNSGRYIAIDLKECSTGKVIRIASAHLWGFDLSRIGDEKEKAKGNVQLAELISLLERDSFPILTIVGMDANSTPELYPERVNLLINRGFNGCSDDSPTAYNAKLPSNRAKLDYILSKSKSGRAQIIADSKVDLPLEDPQNNPSDHRPLTNIVRLPQDKLQTKFIKYFSKFFINGV